MYTYQVSALVKTPAGPETVNCRTTHPRPASERDIEAALADDAAKRHRIPANRITVQVNAFVSA